jgi:hypothetical protein
MSTGQQRFELGLTTALVPITLLMFWQTSQIDAPVRHLEVAPRTMPMILAGLCFASAVLVAAQCWLPWLRARGANRSLEVATDTESLEETLFGDAEDEAGGGEEVSKSTLAVITVGFLISILVLESLGFLVTATALVFGLSTYLAPRSFVRNAIVSVVCISLVSLLFDELGVLLPTGILALH